jgi:hypothetical protein
MSETKPDHAAVSCSETSPAETSVYVTAYARGGEPRSWTGEWRAGFTFKPSRADHIAEQPPVPVDAIGNRLSDEAERDDDEEGGDC